MFKVVVPLKNKKKISRRWITHVTYPPTGCSLYTREQAIDVLRKFYQRYPWLEGDSRECWAEGEHERFTLHFPEQLV